MTPTITATALSARGKLGHKGQGHNALNTFGVELLVLRMHQGRAGEFEEIVRVNMEEYPDLPSWRTGLVIVGLNSGSEAVLRRRGTSDARGDRRQGCS